MELITVLLSSLLLLVSPVGTVLDQVAENAIRDRLAAAESLDVRIDNGPSYQLLQGRVDQVRIAGRGISPLPGLRFEIAELETDPIDLALRPLRQGQVVLDKAFQGAARVVISEADLNVFLASPLVAQQLGELSIGALNPAQARERDRYQINNPTVDFLENDRIRVSAELEDLVQAGSLIIEAETGVSVVAGDRLLLESPTLVVNDQPVPERLINAVIGGFSDQLSLQRFDDSGITARVLNLTVQPESMDLALWVRVDPSVTAPDN